MRVQLVAMAVVVGLLSTLGCSGLPSRAAEPPPEPVPAAPRPSFILVLTDDLDLPMMSKFPGLNATIAAKGMTFAENFVSLSLCCASRATLLRGQYAHDTGVFGNKAPHGGFQRFHDQGEEDSTLATWLHDAGYRTGLFGKYLNGFPEPLPGTYVPPGWDTFVSALGAGGYRQYDYDLAVDGKIEHHGTGKADYLTDLLDVRARAFVQSAVKDNQPFFAYIAPFSPHSPATPAPRYEDAFPDELKAPRGPAFDEADLSDKPAWLRDAPKLNSKQLAFIDERHRMRLQSMEAVQDLVLDLVKTLEAAGRLDDTYVMFTSDNGFHMGEHRLSPGKNTEFDTDLRVPLIVRGPGVPAGKTVTQLTANVDLAPTIAELAGLHAPGFVDGRSLAGLLHGETPSPWRQGLLLEHRGPDQLDEGTDGPHEWPDTEDAAPPRPAPAPAGRGAKAGKGAKSGGAKDGDGLEVAAGVPVFVGVRTAQWSYIEYESGERELYDVLEDPDQLVNVARTADPAVVAALRDRTAALSACHAETCRSAEE